ncbi:hypothetical protein B0H19DRAFT_1058139 [Mycena capillaripes]|nr:hypothetical protein B0H19DRAFT_1058139 [Mycena capillaripes]
MPIAGEVMRSSTSHRERASRMEFRRVGWCCRAVQSHYCRRLACAGPLDRSDPVALRIRLLQLKDKIEEHIVNSGVGAALERLKKAYLEKKSGLMMLRMLHHSSVTAQRSEQSSTCPSEEEEDAAAELEAQQRVHKGVVAATGKAARLEQLVALKKEALQAEEDRRPVDPAGYAPFGKPIGSPAFDAHFLKLDDGQVLVNASRLYGRTAAANNAQLRNQAHIGEVSHAAAVLRHTRDNTGISPAIQTERTDRRKLLLAALKDVRDPRRFSHKPLLDSWRWAECSPCGEVVVARDKNTYHRCAAVLEGSTKITITATNFPTLRRICFSHDILGNPKLETLLQDPADMDAASDGLEHRAVSTICKQHRQALENTLSSEANAFDLESVDEAVFLPSSLAGEADLWLTLAVDVLLRVQNRCPSDWEPPTAEQRDPSASSAGALTNWYQNRTHHLFIFKCNQGGYAIISKPKEPAYYLHTCEHGRARLQEYAAQRKADSSLPTHIVGYNSELGPRCCPNQMFRRADSLLDVPFEFGRFVSARSRLDIGKGAKKSAK